MNVGQPYNVQLVINLYKGGLTEYEKGLTILIPSTGGILTPKILSIGKIEMGFSSEGDEADRAVRLQSKMRANVVGIKERIRELEGIK